MAEAESVMATAAFRPYHRRACHLRRCCSRGAWPPGAAARRCASLLGELVGRRVGYTVRLDSKTSRATRVEFVTTGVLLRRLMKEVRLIVDVTASTYTSINDLRV